MIRTLIFLLFLFTVLKCKKTPTFSADNPLDIYSESFIVPPPENVEFQVEDNEVFMVSWEINNYEYIEKETVFLVELIIDDSIIQEIATTESFTKSFTFAYELIPNKIYKISVTTVFNRKKSTPVVSEQALELSFSAPPRISFFQQDSTNIIFSWVQEGDFAFDQELSLKNLNTNEIIIYPVESNPSNRFQVILSDLDVNHNYEVGISEVINGIKSESYISTFSYSENTDINITFSYSAVDEGIYFFESAIVPYTDYLIATDGGEIYIINKKNNNERKSININSFPATNLVARSNGIFFTYKGRRIFQGDIYTGSYSLLEQVGFSSTTLPFFGLTGTDYDYLYYPKDDKIIFKSIISPEIQLEISNNGVDHICTGYMEDQFLTLSDNEIRFYTFPDLELRSSYTASEGIYFFSCEFNDLLDTVFLTGYNTNEDYPFFASMDKTIGTLTNFSIISTETGFSNLYLNQLNNQIIITSSDPEIGELSSSPFYIYDLESEELTKTASNYRGLNNPKASVTYDGRFVYTTFSEPNSLEEIKVGEGWILIEK